MQVFKGALKKAIKEYQKKYGVSNFRTLVVTDADIQKTKNILRRLCFEYFHFEIPIIQKDQEYCTCTFRGLKCFFVASFGRIAFFVVVFRVYKFSKFTLICRQILSGIL